MKLRFGMKIKQVILVLILTLVP
ncbi:hypothetical protein CY0110_18797 [Crocosphaera chwakensis CCY0110]|uniref:Uncharacterized protein n=1 Tax=Crocosphaera chwakensis CCY0110 TaxID=391612 RepID=A3IJ91_9CHRO|nr:hypothetical protein CY0110_18797 [Crocosphaera chwakensis CCY0110]